MPLLFLISYIAISYFMYKKHKDIKESNFPLIIKLSGLIAFALLFVFIIYYSEQDIPSRISYMYSFYLLLISYIITFIFYLLRYKNNIAKSKLVLINNNGKIETWINKSYFIIVLVLSSIYFLYSDKSNLINDDGLQILLYLFFVLSSLYILFERKILSIK